MSKKTAKVSSVSEEPKKELTYLSSQLKIESPSSKLSSISTKEEFETLFQEYNKYFIMIGHEITNLDIINEELKNYISLIQKSFNDKFGEAESDGDFSGLDDDEDDDGESVASDNSSVPPEPEGGGKKKKATVKQTKKVEEDSDDGNESPTEAAPKKSKDKKVTVKATKAKVEEVVETKSKKDTKTKVEKTEKVDVTDKKKKSKKDE